MKVIKRDSPPVTASQTEYGVPVFLDQLVEALRCDESNPGQKYDKIPWNKSAGAVESSRTAALHGKELLDEGYTVDQVVHGYGDICQSLTELAAERTAPITVDEFHTFNRLLDNAIADAVSSYGRYSDSAGAHDLHDRLGSLAEKQRALLQTALKALEALKVGNLGLKGATGSLLEDSLKKLRDLVDQSMPEIRLSAGMTTPTGP